MRANGICGPHPIRIVLGLWLAVACLAGCRSASVEPEADPSSAAAVAAPEIILLWPLADMATDYGPDAEVRSPVGGRIFKTAEPVPPDTLRVLNDELMELAGQRPGIRTLPPGRARAVASTLMESNPGGLAPRTLFMETGRTVGADAVLAGYIYRFRPRIGKSYSVDRPASVALGLFLINCRTGATLWSAQFDETQRSLSENLLDLGLFMRRGGSWITAEDMARGAMADLMARFPTP